MFGRKFNGLKNFEDIQVEENIQQLHNDITSLWIQHKKIVLPAINERTFQIKKKQEEILNKRKQLEIIKPGTTVMVVNPMKKSKWEANYEGPYTVIKRTQAGTYVLKDQLNVELKRNYAIDQLKIINVNKEGRNLHYR